MYKSSISTSSVSSSSGMPGIHDAGLGTCIVAAPRRCCRRRPLKMIIWWDGPPAWTPMAPAGREGERVVRLAPLATLPPARQRAHAELRAGAGAQA